MAKARQNRHQPGVLFLAVNASYAHTNLAGWYLRQCAEQAGFRWLLLETTVGEPIQPLLAAAEEFRPDILAATFYLFNRSHVLAFARRLKALRPECVVVGGGPEFLGSNATFLVAEQAVDAVVRGEGENAFCRILEHWDRPARWLDIPGVCGRREDGACFDNGMAEPVAPLVRLPSPYDLELRAFHKPFVLLETSRGCSGRCSFCASAGSAPVRFMTLERVRSDLAAIARAGVRDVRLVDRTFNENPARCEAMLQLFAREFPMLRLHLEVDPARLTGRVMVALRAAGTARLHLELGVQSLESAVLRNVSRRPAPGRVLKNLHLVCRLDGAATHVDLLAGLPGGTLMSLLRDMDRLSRIGPSKIQLETLKILPGTPLAGQACALGIVAAPDPPYEILRTPTMTEADMEQARVLSRLADWFYNAPQLRDVIIEACRTGAGFWSGLLAWCVRRITGDTCPSLERRFEIMAEFFAAARPALVRRLGYAWLRHGLSPSRGPVPAQPWKAPLPDDAVLVEGDDAARAGRMFVAELDAPHIFIYGNGQVSRGASAVFRLSSDAEHLRTRASNRVSPAVRRQQRLPSR